jgi:hypothetical protein
MLPYALIITAAVYVGGPDTLILPPLEFNNADDCRQAATVAAALIAVPMKAYCIDDKTGEKISEASRNHGVSCDR